MSRMNADVVGKVHNTRLNFKDGIMALFEALANSIQSIDDAKIIDGSILIELTRKKSLYDGQEDGFLPIDSIKVCDNGVGFIEDNFSSFLSSDSTYKLSRGGKGIGRFAWLKVFDHASVESTFDQDGKPLKRYFEFVNNRDAIVNEKFESNPSGNKNTTISLKHIKDGYLQKFPREIGDLADQIIEHLIMRLISPSCPSIILRDISVSPTIEIDINHRFNAEFLLDSDVDSFSVNNYSFSVALLKVKANDVKATHSIYLSGNDRVVKSTPLSKYIPSLTAALLDEERGEPFCIKALVSSDYLDSNVNNERTKFSLRNGGDVDASGDLINEITLSEIEGRTAETVSVHFENYLDSLRQTKRVKLEQVIYTDFPHLIPLLEYDKVIDSITPTQLQDKNKLNLALQKAKYEILLQAKQEVVDIQSTMENISEDNVSPEMMIEYKKGFDRLVEKLTNITKSELSEYVVHRRILLDIFEKLLSKKNDGTYPWEEEIHKLIFPKGKSSEDMLGIAQNLWLIDERLSYHRYVSSDLPLDKKKKKSVRPDVLIGKQVVQVDDRGLGFDMPIAFTENAQVAAYDSMVILEFKRAMRKDYAGEKDPIDQIKGYIREIRNGKALDPKGRPIIVSESCRFYAYLICDLTPALKNEIKEMHDFTPMVEGNGLFAMLKSLNAYVEVISYNKILADSAQRNRVLFEKLQIDYN
jgi:soluble cytochrome b562